MCRLILQIFTSIVIALQLTGCAGPHVYTNSMKKVVPALEKDFAVMADGYKLPYHFVSTGDQQPQAIVLALHGFNDYSKSFLELGEYLGKKKIAIAAYDQRGFGRTKGVGYWHGTDRLTDDLLVMVQLLKERYNKVPLIILGESMGGAVALASLKSLQKQNTFDGLILLAPAVWARETMPWYQRISMAFFAHVLPGLIVSGEGLDITPSDNDEMLRALGKDPLVLKETRIDALYGLTNLMDTALASASLLKSNTLILYGQRDEIIPRQPTCKMLKNLPSPAAVEWRLILYEEGYHLLTRDLQAEKVFKDIETWISKKIENEQQPQTGIQEEDMKFICN